MLRQADTDETSKGDEVAETHLSAALEAAVTFGGVLGAAMSLGSGLLAAAALVDHEVPTDTLGRRVYTGLALGFVVAYPFAIAALILQLAGEA